MENRNSLPSKGPDFIIIGAMKCATSTMHDQLNMQDSFFMANPKEPCFFSDNAVYLKGINWYESLFQNALRSQIKGESSTHYTKLLRYPETVSRIKLYYPNIKLIYMMRHPVDRLVSHYIHEWTQGVISCKIDQAVYNFPELIEYSRYNMQIEPYLNTFGSSAVLPIFVERLWNNPIHELQALFNFIGVREKPVWHADIRSNVSSVRLRVCSWRDAIVNNNIVRFLRRRFVPKQIRRAIRNLWTMKERPALSPDSLSYVEELFDRDLKLLGDKLGLKLNCKNFKDKITLQRQINWVL